MEKNAHVRIREWSQAETLCVNCGSNAFQLTRTTSNQIMLVCLECGHPHLLNADRLDERAVITFWTEKAPARGSEQYRTREFGVI